MEPQRDLALILARDLAAQLSTPMFLVDPAGTLVYFNEPAEAVLGRRWSEAGELSADEWASAFSPRDEDGAPIPRGELPLSVALAERRAAHGTMRITGMDGSDRVIAVTAIPLMPHPEELIGALAIFWDSG